MSAVTDFARWLDTDFADLNTELEEAYFASRAEIVYGVTALDQHKNTLADEGATPVGRLGDSTAGTASTASTAGIDGIDGIDGTAASYELLGAVGLYLAACRRHEVDAPEHAQAVAGRLGLALGVAPRMVFAHMSTHNPAGHTFTRLPDEHAFTTYNALGVLSYQRSANALRRATGVAPDGPLAACLLDDAHTALADVLHLNQTLAEELDRDRFFYNIRPYFKPHMVCGTEYRGANAGDYSAVNEIDLALGLCDRSDPFYQRILAEKYPYVPPEDQPRLRTPPTTLRIAPDSPNTARFLAGLSRLVDLRTARDRPGTAHARLARLRAEPVTAR